MADWSLGNLISIGETKQIDVKGPMKWDPKHDRKTCCELTKDILGFANTGGGQIVIGIQEPLSGFVPVGLDPDQLKSWDSTPLNDFLKNYVSSPINCTVTKPADNNMTFVVIGVPAFNILPHICTKDYQDVLRRAAFYVRSSSNASVEITDPDEFDPILAQMLRNHADSLLTQFKSVLTGASTVESASDLEQFEAFVNEAQQWLQIETEGQVPDVAGSLQVTAHPARFNADRFTSAELRSAAEKSSYEYGLWYGLLYQGHAGARAFQDAIQTTAHDLAGDKGRFYGWRMYRSGLYIHKQVITDDVQLDGNTPWGFHSAGELISIERLAAFVAIAIDTTIELMRNLGVSDEDVTVRIDLIGAKNRRLRAPVHWTLIDSGLVSDMAEMHVAGTRAIEDWIADKVDYATAMASELMGFFNMKYPYSRQRIEEVFASRRR